MINAKSAKEIIEKKFPNREVVGGNFDEKRNAYCFSLPYVKGDKSNAGKVYGGLMYLVDANDGSISSKHFLDILEEDE